MSIKTKWKQLEQNRYNYKAKPGEISEFFFFVKKLKKLVDKTKERW
jgi:hypothetical protein